MSYVRCGWSGEGGGLIDWKCPGSNLSSVYSKASHSKALAISSSGFFIARRLDNKCIARRGSNNAIPLGTETT